MAGAGPGAIMPAMPQKSRWHRGRTPCLSRAGACAHAVTLNNDDGTRGREPSEPPASVRGDVRSAACGWPPEVRIFRERARQNSTHGSEIIMPDNGICERFHRTVLDEFYRIAFRKKIYHAIDELQADLDAWLVEYNYRRAHQGRWCFGKTPMQTFLDAIPLAREKIMAA
jgi:hypothetical protein